MGASRRLSSRGVKSRYSSENVDALQPSTPRKIRKTRKTEKGPKGDNTPKGDSTPQTNIPSKTNSTPKTNNTPKANSTPKADDTSIVADAPKASSPLRASGTPKMSAAANAASTVESSILSKPSSPPEFSTASETSIAVNPGTPSKTIAESNVVTYSEAINDAVASLSREFEIPISLSHQGLDQKAINDVMGIYLNHGIHNWDNHTKTRFAKILSFIKFTSSSQTITSNHVVWRVVTKEGWNWAYWIAFRTIYGKNRLENRNRLIKAVETIFPDTDIWSAQTPAGMTPSKLENKIPKVSIATPSIATPSSVAPSSATPSSVTPSSAIPSSASPSIAFTNERKRPHHALVTEGGSLGQRTNLLRTKRRRRYVVAQPTPEALSPPESSAGTDDREKNLQQDTACQGLNPPVLEEPANEATEQSIPSLVREPNVLRKQRDNTIGTKADETNQSSTDVVTAGNVKPKDAAKPTEVAKPAEAAKPTEEWAAPIEDAKQGLMFLRLKQELTAQVAAQVQESELRTRKRIADLPRPSVTANNYIGQILAEMLDIKQRLSALEEDNQARIRNAATFNVPSGLSGDSVLRALETLGHQVHNCTRDIYQLKTSQQYEEDPILSCVKRELVEASDSGVEEI
ncbi:hypothetical protein EDB80DRAFT_838041 [Ilyonectria destructans]|nr:hypothetical protein EDB80DRAFT_838041 [Ilyonectria destructans]